MIAARLSRAVLRIKRVVQSLSGKSLSGLQDFCNTSRFGTWASHWSGVLDSRVIVCAKSETKTSIRSTFKPGIKSRCPLGEINEACRMEIRVLQLATTTFISTFWAPNHRVGTPGWWEPFKQSFLTLLLSRCYSTNNWSIVGIPMNNDEQLPLKPL